MGNNKTIQPIQVWSSSGQKTASVLGLTNFFDYHFDNGSGKVTYKLIGFDNGAAVEYITETIDIPAAIIQQWGTDDSIIWDYVANQLNLTIID